MFVEDFADALIYFMNKKTKEPFINIGVGKDFTIEWYARYIMKKLGVNNTAGIVMYAVKTNLVKPYQFNFKYTD